MKLRNWMIAAAIICLLFGLGFAIQPVAMLAFYGPTADHVGLFMTRIFGSVFFTLGLLMGLPEIQPSQPPNERLHLPLSLMIALVSS